MAANDAPEAAWSPQTLGSRSPRSTGAPVGTIKSYPGSGTLVLQPELWQPSIFAVSVTYIAYAIATHFEFLPLRPASRQFAYVCCIAGLISASLIYVRYLAREHYYARLSVAIITCLLLTLVMYIVYWLVQPAQESFDQLSDEFYRRPNKWPFSQLQPTFRPTTAPPTNPTSERPLHPIGRIPDVCRESLKCSHPLHLVLQATYMFSVLLCLIMTTIQVLF